VTLGVFVIFLSLPAAIAKVHLKRAAIGYKDRNAVAIDGLHSCKFCRPFGTLLQLPAADRVNRRQDARERHENACPEGVKLTVVCQRLAFG